MKVQLMIVELFAFPLTVLTYEIFVFPFCNFRGNLTTLIDENRLPLLRESCLVSLEPLESQFLY